MKLIITSIIKNINREVGIYDRIFRSFLEKYYVIRNFFAFFEVPSIPWKPVIAGFFYAVPKSGIIKFHRP